MTVLAGRIDARFFWVEKISKDVFMTAFTFLSPANGVKLDHHVNRPYA